MTNEDIVSRITNGYKLLNKDGRLSKRYILHVAEKNAEFLISHKLRDKTLSRESNLYSSIECFELEPKDSYSCGVLEFKSCNKLMRSKKKLSDLIYSKYGGSIRQVTPIDFMSQETFIPSTIQQYKTNKRRLNKYDNSNYCYLKDGYLYIPESDIKAISLEAIVVNTFNLADLDKNFEKSCKSAWEYEFKCPDKLIKTLVDTVREELQMPLQVPRDENPNMDENIKSRA